MNSTLYHFRLLTQKPKNDIKQIGINLTLRMDTIFKDLCGNYDVIDPTKIIEKTLISAKLSPLEISRIIGLSNQ